MVEVNWKKDYKREFICPKCNGIGLKTCGANKGKQMFKCTICNKFSLSSCNVKVDPNYNFNWLKDYKNEFVCPDCDTPGLRMAGKDKGTKKRNFKCLKCNRVVQESINIKIDLTSNINWHSDYKREFICPYCEKVGLRLANGKSLNNKKQFKCHSCNRFTTQSIDIRPELDSSINWSKDYKVGDFICSSYNCDSRDIHLYGTFGPKDDRKRRFICKTCGATTQAFISLNQCNASRFTDYSSNAELLAVAIKSFSFENDQWDLRAINPNFDKQITEFNLYFHKIKPTWFKLLTKQYLYYLCKLDRPFTTICHILSNLRVFSYFLASREADSSTVINRDTILEFLAWHQPRKGLYTRLIYLREFFFTANSQGWLQVDQYIIRDTDFPKFRRGNPDPIPKAVREKIEKNLHKLPEPIARMWIISFFTAMRSNELISLRKNCLVQEGSNWKIVWFRKKGKDHHELPITRTIAKVIQEQIDYIENLWGSDWDHLFCHYQGLSSSNPSQPRMQPIRKVIPARSELLSTCIRCLIKAENICDDNGNLAVFTPRSMRSTRLTQLFEQGHDLNVVSTWAGHKNLITTSLFYTQVSCELMEKEAGHIQRALFNADGKPLHYESMPKSFWNNPRAHQLELPSDHINTPIYGYCSLPLEQRCDKFRACYTCPCFVATPEKLPLYIKTHDELRAKEARARNNGQEVLVEQFQSQANQLEKVIASLQERV